MGKKSSGMPTLPMETKEEEDTAIETNNVNIEIPAADPRAGYVNTRVDLSRMSTKQIFGLHFIVSGLDKSGATLENGTRVVTAVDSFRWLLEQTANEMPIDWKPPGY